MVRLVIGWLAGRFNGWSNRSIDQLVDGQTIRQMCLIFQPMSAGYPIFGVSKTSRPRRSVTLLYIREDIIIMPKSIMLKKTLWRLYWDMYRNMAFRCRFVNLAEKSTREFQSVTNFLSYYNERTGGGGFVSFNPPVFVIISAFILNLQTFLENNSGTRMLRNTNTNGNSQIVTMVNLEIIITINTPETVLTSR